MPDRAEAEFTEAVKSAYPQLVEELKIHAPNWVTITCKQDAFSELASALKEKFGFTHPLSAGAIDWPKESKIEMIYYLMNPSSRLILTIRVDLPRDDCKLPSATRVWEAMSFHEREAREMFGIEFEGHPNPVHILLPPDWKGGYPLRKDFEGEEG